jgi:hypothetical protein
MQSRLAAPTLESTAISEFQRLELTTIESAQIHRSFCLLPSDFRLAALPNGANVGIEAIAVKLP